MDDDLLLISELIDSDDELGIVTDLLFNDLNTQYSVSLSRILNPELKKDGPDLHETSNKDVSNEGCFTHFPLDAATVSCTKISDTLSLSQDDFIRLFRVKQSLVEQITTLLNNAPVTYSDPTNVKVLPKEQIQAVLYFLGQEAITIEDIHNRFNINAVTFDHILKRVTAAVCGLAPKEICLPDKRQKLYTINYYAQKYGLQGVVGCIDTLPISLSKQDSKSRDSCHEWVILQAVVNETAKFTNVFVSKTVETDQDILLMSPLYQQLSSMCSDREYLLGGATYACQEQLLSPYPDHNTSSGGEIYFNLGVAACMQSTEAAFTLLTQRFRKLVDLKLPDSAIAAQLITACCVLHNVSSNADLETLNELPVSREMAVEEHWRINCRAHSLQHSSAGLQLRDDVRKQMLKD